MPGGPLIRPIAPFLGPVRGGAVGPDEISDPDTEFLPRLFRSFAQSKPAGILKEILLVKNSLI